MKRLTSVLLSMLLIIGCFSIVSASAAETAQITVDGKVYVVEVGKTFTYTVNLKTEHKVNNGEFYLGYPQSILTIADDDAFDFPVIGKNNVIYNYNDNIQDEFRFNFSSRSNTVDFTDGGVLVTISFTVTAAGEGSIGFINEQQTAFGQLTRETVLSWVDANYAFISELPNAVFTEVLTGCIEQYTPTQPTETPEETTSAQDTETTEINESTQLSQADETTETTEETQDTEMTKPTEGPEPPITNPTEPSTSEVTEPITDPVESESSEPSTSEVTEPSEVTQETQSTQVTEITEPTQQTETTEASEPSSETQQTLPAKTTEQTHPAETIVHPTEFTNPSSSETQPTTAHQVSITLKANKTKIYVGETTTVYWTISDGVMSSDFKLTSSNTKVATVSVATGKVKGIAAGTAIITASASGAKKTLRITVVKRANPMTVKAATKTVKYKTLKKKAQTVKPITVKKAVGAVSYKKTSGKKFFTVNSKTGKVTVKKGTKKGTYTIKVKVTAKGSKGYKAGSKTTAFKIKVK